MNDLRSAERPGLTTPAAMIALEAEHRRELIDDLATEEPLEIRLAAQGATQSLAVTMRTPGNDFELAAGFLFSEGVISKRDEIAGISYCVDPAVGEEQRYNIVTVELPGALPPLERLERHFTVNSSCGVCGKSSIEALQVRAQPIADHFHVSSEFIAELPDKMRSAQRIFSSTGGLHAGALFDRTGDLLVLREDVGRHNALDKIIGWALLNDRLPLRETVLLVSGRASYELLQKSVTAGIPIVCAVSAPSSLAVDTARAFNVTLCGFVRGTRCNVYTAPDRIIA
ncbi:MAG TPA: formate dehydrogenase accessory sulfurtransferase FdhD [Candidatus Rubrimentiphilum sp.]|nr:formate dehydrogenase accessory sulfurtransferase FdhD [Candidatus Rubrimentiphilum sp.]